jgi:hypothetical protein
VIELAQPQTLVARRLKQEPTEPKKRTHLGRNLFEGPSSVDDKITDEIQLVRGSVVRISSESAAERRKGGSVGQDARP